jgi:hypothetical protein
MAEKRTVVMVLKHTSRIVTTYLLLTSVCVGVLQAQRSAYDPATQGAPAKPKQGFVDYTLKRINPSDKDYGECLDQGRKLVLQESIQNGYFWSNVVTLSLLGCLFIIVVYQHRQRVRREWTIAEIHQQYEHALLRANTQVDEATKKNHELSEALTSARENAIRSPMISTDLRESPTPRTTSKRPAETQPVEATAAKATVIGASAMATSGGENGRKVANQMGLFKPEVDLILKVNSLEQQLGRSQEQEKQLRRQLTQADLRLQAEQQKNRTLKGA